VMPWQRAVFVAQNVPASPVLAGHTFPVNVTMKNTGITTWTSAGPNPQRLGSENPQDNTVWGLGRVDVPQLVPPGSSVMFTFNVTAPLTPGVRPFQWSMVQEGITWFGGFTPEVDFTVQLAPMTASIQPYPIVIGQSRSYTVTVQDANTHQPVNTAVSVNGVQVAQSNVPFTYTFVMKTVRVFDPETRTSTYDHIPPTVVVTAPGYTAVTVDVGVAEYESAAA